MIIYTRKELTIQIRGWSMVGDAKEIKILIKYYNKFNFKIILRGHSSKT